MKKLKELVQDVKIKGCTQQLHLMAAPFWTKFMEAVSDAFMFLSYVFLGIMFGYMIREVLFKDKK